MGVRCCWYGAGPLAIRVLGFGMGRLRGLASGVFRRLAIGRSIPEMYTSGVCPCTRRWMAAPLVRSPLSDIDEEGSYLSRDSDGIEEEGAGWVEAAGGRVSWVLSAWDVSCVYCSLAMF